ncbi:MAG: segregation/condensation protein A [Bacilli bacterium]|nr:segregation/condensation protein A [Bacilli bacterium]
MEITLKIDDFEGPFDLLLHLIKEKKMNLFDIKLEIIIDEYLNFIDKMEEMNLNIASSYLVMASELVELKSKMLLPRYEEENEEEEDPKEVLVNKLIEYQRYKELTEEFKDLENERKMIITKLPLNLKQYYQDDTVVNNGEVTLNDLIIAFQKFLERKKLEEPLHTKVTTKEMSVEERTISIRNVLKIKKKVNFLELFDVLNKEYVVVTFLAILEMARKNELKISQEDEYGDIICEVV